MTFWFLSMLVCVLIVVTLGTNGINVGFWGAITMGVFFGVVGTFMDRLLEKKE